MFVIDAVVIKNKLPIIIKWLLNDYYYYHVNYIKCIVKYLLDGDDLMVK